MKKNMLFSLAILLCVFQKARKKDAYPCLKNSLRKIKF